MPVGLIVFNTPCSSLFIQTLEGTFFIPWPEPTQLAQGTLVTFRHLHLADAPPGFNYADQIQAIPVPAPPQPTPTAPTITGTPLQGAWARPRAATILAASTPSSSPSAADISSLNNLRPSVGPAQAPRNFAPQPLQNRQTREDFDAICAMVDSMKWGRQKGFGPSLQVTTRLKAEGEGQLLHKRVKDQYHDQPIPDQGMYYFVGSMGKNWGKGGFRISAHSRPLAEIEKSITYTVLHIEN